MSHSSGESWLGMLALAFLGVLSLALWWNGNFERARVESSRKGVSWQQELMYGPNARTTRVP